MILGEMEAKLAFSESQFKNFSLFSSIKILNMPSLCQPLLGFSEPCLAQKDFLPLVPEVYKSCLPKYFILPELSFIHCYPHNISEPFKNPFSSSLPFSPQPYFFPSFWARAVQCVSITHGISSVRLRVWIWGSCYIWVQMLILPHLAV